MERTSGTPEVKVALLDGPVVATHPHLATGNLVEISGGSDAFCSRTESAVCGHGTFVAGILAGVRGSEAPSISPGCTLLVRPIFREEAEGQFTSATTSEVALAVHDCIEAGANVVNLSAAFAEPSIREAGDLKECFDFAARQGSIVVAAAGNQGTLGSSPITRHPWVIPVAAFSLSGQPLCHSNLGSSIGRRGLGAPGEGVVSLATDGQALPAEGTSVAAPFVTGAIALLWSEFPHASAAQIRQAVVGCSEHRRRSVVPPLLNAWASYRLLLSDFRR
jgi:subtilisin family serine protease